MDARYSEARYSISPFVSSRTSEIGKMVTGLAVTGMSQQLMMAPPPVSGVSNMYGFISTLISTILTSSVVIELIKLEVKS